MFPSKWTTSIVDLLIYWIIKNIFIGVKFFIIILLAKDWSPVKTKQEEVIQTTKKLKVCPCKWTGKSKKVQ